jgi:hypothetical protein
MMHPVCTTIHRNNKPALDVKGLTWLVLPFRNSLVYRSRTIVQSVGCTWEMRWENTSEEHVDRSLEVVRCMTLGQDFRPLAVLSPTRQTRSHPFSHNSTL